MRGMNKNDKEGTKDEPVTGVSTQETTREETESVTAQREEEESWTTVRKVRKDG